MAVDTPAPAQKKTPRKKKRRNADDVFPALNLQAFVELLELTLTHNQTSLTATEKVHVMLILIMCLVDDKCDDGELQAALSSCISAFADNVCLEDLTPVQLAGQTAMALVPNESFAKARLLCRLVAVRITPRTENGHTFVRTLSFFFAKRILGQEINASDVLPTGPSLEQIRHVIVHMPRPTRENADLYWVVRCAVILLQNAIKYHVRETRVNKSVLDGIKQALEKLSKTMKEDANAPVGLTTCKEVTLLTSVHIGLLQAAFLKSGMNTLNQYLTPVDTTDSKKPKPTGK
eukprot:TRINITY_DN2368_c0_g2_i1.p1 TRINITY_DN2368_c0_g2~~TRINITY_DN2368_c0_g2_i1.p1  ORF type:complete len:290 (-),score=50.36 TRINITY_DN2368_c0_g2_i1:114-983(-)